MAGARQCTGARRANIHACSAALAIAAVRLRRVASSKEKSAINRILVRSGLIRDSLVSTEEWVGVVGFLTDGMTRALIGYGRHFLAKLLVHILPRLAWRSFGLGLCRRPRRVHHQPHLRRERHHS